MSNSLFVCQGQFSTFDEYKAQGCPKTQLASTCFAYPAYISWFIETNQPGEPMSIWEFAGSDTCSLIATTKANQWNGDAYELFTYMPNLPIDLQLMLGFANMVGDWDDSDDD